VAALAVYGGGLLALPLSGYTAVLLSTTAVPVWQKTSRTLPYLFVASAASSAASLLGMANLDDHEAKIVTRFGTVAALAELVAGNAVERDASEVERVGRPLREGLAGSLWKASTRLSLASLAIAALPGRGRAQRIVSGLLGAGAGLCLRFSIFHAGKVSARDPRATFAHQHHGFGGAEVTGRPAVRAPAGADP
jgi:formate-dependent nitrite reductase membrane component NrfD